MRMDLTIMLALAATAADGLLAGASLDQSLKQLPARHRLGPVAFSAYSRAADLESGIIWYGALGLGSAALTIGAAGAARRQPVQVARPFDGAAILAVLHSLVTARAAPLTFSQRQIADDPAALTDLFDRFARWRALRAVLQLATFGMMLRAIARSANT